MANRTFKMMGRAYAASGDVTVTLTVDGTQVFNSTVSTQNTALGGPPQFSDLSELVTWTLDESVTGAKSATLAVSGGQFIMGPIKCNGAHSHYQNWADIANLDPSNVTADEQSAFADLVGSDALGADLYNALKAGTVTNPTDAQRATMDAADQAGPMNTVDYVWLLADNDQKASAQVNGVDQPGWDDAETSAKNYLMLEDGDTLTTTWSITPTDNYPEYHVDVMNLA